MMQKKKFVTAILTAAFLGAGAAPAWADEVLLIAPNPMTQEQITAETEEIAQEQGMQWMLTMGTVKEVMVFEEENLTAILVESNGQEYEFYLSDTTWLADGAGRPIAADALAAQMVVVAHSEAATFSLPPKSNAMAVMVYDSVLPNYAVIEAITFHDDGTAVVTTDNGNRLVTIQADAQVTPFRTRNVITLQDLRVGDTVILYYDVLAPSIPAQASTAKVVQLAAALPDVTAEDGIITEQAVQMVHLREAVTAMDMELDWDGETSTVIVRKDAFSAVIYIGSEDYGINRMRVKAALPAELRDGRTYVSSDVIEAIEAAIR